MIDLKAFLARPHRWEWGTCDCTTFAGSWVSFRTGIDPASGVRGTYATREEAEAIVAAHGGIQALGAAMLGPHGFRQVQRPADGDVAIVKASLWMGGDAVFDGLMPGICFGPLWAVMSLRGPQVKALELAGPVWRIA